HPSRLFIIAAVSLADGPIEFSDQSQRRGIMDRAATVLAERTVPRLRPLLPTDMRGNPRVDDGCLINVVGGGHCYCLDQCFATMHRTAPDEAAAPMARPENSATRLRLRASTAENGERFGRSLH